MVERGLIGLDTRDWRPPTELKSLKGGALKGHLRMASMKLATRRTRRQKSLQAQLSDHDFYTAVPIAVKTLFRFTHRASDAKALWSDAHVETLLLFY